MKISNHMNIKLVSQSLIIFILQYLIIALVPKLEKLYEYQYVGIKNCFKYKYFRKFFISQVSRSYKNQQIR